MRGGTENVRRKGRMGWGASLPGTILHRLSRRAPEMAAGDKKVSVAGADVPQQAIRAGLLDEIHIHLVPVLLGEGKRLFDHLGNQRIDLERTRVVEAPEGVTHLRFRVKR